MAYVATGPLAPAEARGAAPAGPSRGEQTFRPSSGLRAGFAMRLLALAVLSLASLSWASRDAQRRVSTEPAETRTIHLISVSDTHGWIYGHRHEADRDLGEYGYFLSYIERAKGALGPGESAFVVDGGDKIEGTGLSDGVRDGTVKGYYIHQASARIPWDLQVAGNHDISRKSVTDYLHENIESLYGENYVTTNIFMLPPDFDGSDEPGDFEALDTLSPYTHRYTVLDNGLRVLSFGFMYGGEVFEGVKAVAARDVLATERYQKLLHEYALKTDVLILADHISAGSSEMEDIRSSIRAVFDQYNNTAPILLVAGHSHSVANKFCRAEDQEDQEGPNGQAPYRQCYIVEAKRYMEVLQHGIFSFEPRPYVYSGEEYSGVRLADVYYHTPVDFERTALAERFGLSPDGFMTEGGQALKDQIDTWLKDLGISTRLGCARYSYTTSQSATPNLFDLWLGGVVPSQVVNDALPNEHLSSISPGSCRAPIYEGEVIRDDVFTVMPFPDEMLYFPDLTGTQAACLFNHVNHWEEGMTAEQRLEASRAWAEQRAAELRAAIDRMAAEGYVDVDFPLYYSFPQHQLERIVVGSSYVINFNTSDLDPDALYDVSMLDYDMPVFEEAMRAGSECNPDGPDVKAIRYPAQPDPEAKTDDMFANFFLQYMRCDGLDRVVSLGGRESGENGGEGASGAEDQEGPTGLESLLRAAQGTVETQKAAILGTALIFTLIWAVSFFFVVLAAAKQLRK